MPLIKRTRRHFTESARAAALQARRRKRKVAGPRATLAAYVVRLPGAHLQSGWEIRRFGAMVLDEGSMRGPTMPSARSAGEAAVSGRAIDA